jgi:hypothetical protein
MNAEAIEIESKVDELLTILDRDIEHIQQSLSRLSEMRELVVKRDEVSLGRLLESVQTESDIYAANEQRRQAIRKTLADLLGIEQITLSKLEQSLSMEKKAEVSWRKTKLRLLASQLKKEHLSAAILLTECARFNRLLLNGILGRANHDTVMYDSSGLSKRQSDTAFMSLNF